MPKVKLKFAYIAMFLSLFACISAPVTERKQFIVVPEAQMEALGVQAYQEILKKEPRSKNQDLVREVQYIGEEIAKASKEKNAWEFNLFQEDKTVNAFCLPGGKVGVYTGILPIAKTNAGLAAIIGHEVAHATLRHGAERMSQSIASQVGLTLAAISLDRNQYRDLILSVLGVGVQVGFALPYSRLHEKEADEVGLLYMARAGYDPRAAIEVWEAMAKQQKGQPPEFLSTHPVATSRIEYLKQLLPKVMPIYEASQKKPIKQLNLN